MDIPPEINPIKVKRTIKVWETGRVTRQQFYKINNEPNLTAFEPISILLLKQIASNNNKTSVTIKYIPFFYDKCTYILLDLPTIRRES